MDNIAYKYNRFLIAIFVFAPFVAYFPIAFRDISFNKIMQMLSYIGVILILIFREKKYQIRLPKYLLFYFFFILFVFYSEFMQLDRDFKFKYLFSNYLIGGFNFMFIIENMPPISKKHYNFIIHYSKYILIIAVLVIVYQQAVDPNFYVYISSVDDIIQSSGNKTRLPSIYSWLTSLSFGFSFISIFLIVVEDLDKKKKYIIIWVIMGIIYSFLSKSRWAMLNTLLVFVVLLINRKNIFLYFIKYLFILPLAIYISLLSLNVVNIDVTGIVEQRILEKDKKEIGQKKSATTRILAFKAFSKLFLKHPYFGVGDIRYGMAGTGKQDYELRSILKGRSSQIHVGYLSLLYMYGIVGGFFFLSFLYLFLKKLYINAKSTGMWAPFLGFLGFAIANLTLVAFSVFEMGFIIALVVDKYYSQSKKLEKNQFA